MQSYHLLDGPKTCSLGQQAREGIRWVPVVRALCTRRALYLFVARLSLAIQAGSRVNKSVQW